MRPRYGDPTLRGPPTEKPVLDDGLGDDTSGCHCVAESLVVAQVLLGAGLGEVGDRVLEAVSGAQVRGDGDPVAKTVVGVTARRRSGPGPGS
jgi:hypothetical protein